MVCFSKLILRQISVQLSLKRKFYARVSQKLNLVTYCVSSNSYTHDDTETRINIATGRITQCNSNTRYVSVAKKNQLDVTFCILYFSSNSCSTCFGQPCAHHQEMTTALYYSLVLVCAVAAWRLSSPAATAHTNMKL